MDDLELTAYHEAGHAVACVLLDIPFKYATIKPEGNMLGHVLTNLSADAYEYSGEHLLKILPYSLLLEQ